MTSTTTSTHSVLIIGAGSAGSVLAHRLSADPEVRVTLLEAGPDYGTDYPEAVMNSDNVGAATGSDWGYTTEPGIVDHRIAAYRGKVVGGSSAVNGSVMVRALPSDFERWAAGGLEGWSYADVLPYYRKLEHTANPDPQWHGRTGPMPVHQLSTNDVTPMQRAFIAAAEAVGVPRTDDFNGPDPYGVGPYPMNIVDGRRINTGVAYLTPDVRDRPNLTVRGDTLVDRVLFEAGRAVGAQLADGSVIEADEVILSGGTYGSAATLLRSGVGPKAELERHGVVCVVDAPVGTRVVDHPFYYVAFAAHADRVGSQSPAIGAKAWISSSLAAPGEQDLHLTATHLIDQDLSPTGAAFVVAVAMVRPLSRGTVSLTSTDPTAAPRIDLGFLAEPQDRARLLEGIDLARRIGRTAPLAGLIDHEIAPGATLVSDDAVIASAISTLDTYHHPTSSAPMGPPDSGHAVVDSHGRVHGVAGLRVVDASILPDVPQAATNPTVIMAAEKISDDVLDGLHRS